MQVLSPIIAMNIIIGALGVILAIANQYILQYGECEIDVNGGEEEFKLEGGNSLLGSLAENETFIPSACGGQGSCGYCKVKVPQGGGPVLPTEEPILTREELIDGYRLACQVKVRNDVSVEMPPEWLYIEKFDAEVLSTKQLTSTIKEIVFGLLEPQKIEFKPGQYIQIQVPTNNGYEERAYSIASKSSVKDKIMLNVRLVEGGLGSTYLHSLEEGQTIEFTGPFGDFVIRDTEKEIVCVAGGVGLAPIRSMILSILENGTDRKIWLFYGARERRDLYYYEELHEVAQKYDKLEFVPALDTPDPKWDGEVGLITDVMANHLKVNSRREAYLCGPPPMMDAAIDVLRNLEVPKESIYYDDFSS